MTKRAGMMLAIGLWTVAPAAAGAQAAPLDQPTKRGRADDVRLLLPHVIYAVPGIEMNVYFDNVVLVPNPTNYAFDVDCKKGIQQAERWTYTPSDKDVGEYALAIKVYDQSNQVIARAASTIRVVARDAGAGRSISALLVGDSLTHASIYSQHLLDLCKGKQNPTLTLIGSHVPKDPTGQNRHEGYGGWTAERFATYYTGTARTGNYHKRGSPFLYKDASGKPRLDFARYCEDVNNGRPPDVVTFFLGCNDTFSASDQNIEQRIGVMFTNLDALIAMVRKTSDKTRIGLILLVPPAGSQDAFGANYGCGQTRWQYKRNQHRVVERMIEHYSKRAKDGITLIPAFVDLDCRRNYPTTTAPANSQTTSIAARLTNGVHPSPEGYRQIGDSIYCWMKAQLAKR